MGLYGESRGTPTKKKKLVLKKSLFANWTFDWKYCRRSWEQVSSPVFIDFGEEELFWVKEGMGNSWGKGLWVEKQKFIEKYGGDFQYYQKNKTKRKDIKKSQSF